MCGAVFLNNLTGDKIVKHPSYKLNENKKMNKAARIFLALLGYMAFNLSANAQYKLWYKEPAATWTEALPLGNGRLGAMVYGIPAVERIQLNEETLWAGQPNDNANPDAKNALPIIQDLIWKGEYLKAQDMATANNYMTAAELARSRMG